MMIKFLSQVKAVDAKNNYILSTCSVTVNIVDTNDNGPIFEQPGYDFNVTENNCNNTIFGSINVSLTNDINDCEMSLGQVISSIGSSGISEMF